MIYWNSVCREAMRRPDHAFRSHSEAELAAFNRSLRRRTTERRTTERRTRPSSRADRAVALRKIVAVDKRMNDRG